MLESGDREERFDEKQMSRILSLAARIQEREGEAAAPAREASGGFSLEELQQIAAEVGIDPRHVVAAARELAGREEPEGFLLTGAPATWEIERVVAGQASPADWEEMVAEIRRSLGRPGTPGTLGNSFEWHGRNTDPSVSVSPRGGETRLRIALRSGELMVACYLIAGLYSFLGGAIASETLHLSRAAELAIATGIFGGGLGLTRQMLRLWFRRKSRTIRKLMERLTQQVAMRSATSTPPALEPPAPGADPNAARLPGSLRSNPLHANQDG